MELINEFDQLGIEVLSPAKSEIANPGEEFVILKSDDIKSVKDLEQRHLDAIPKADFLYVCDPGGYIGRSVSMEIGYAHALGRPIYALEKPEDAMLAEFVETKRPSDLQ